MNLLYLIMLLEGLNMKILIINGSPKGENSVTYHTCLYMEKKYPEHEYDVIHAGQRIAGIQKKFDEVIPQLKQADMIVFSYPVYTFLVPSQLHRFIELMKEVDLKDKYVIQISTSKHFYDVTAHEFIKENCLDMGMKYLGGLSADMGDLTSESGRKEADDFFSTIFFKMEQGIYETGSFVPYVEDRHTYFKEVSGPKDTTKKVVIIADIKDEKDILRDKIAYFQSIFPYETKVINLNEMTIHGGCLGCMNCATDGKCIYKDHFDEFLRNEIQQMDGTIYAYTIKDHSMGYKMKLYDDRQFCNGHRTVTMGKPVGYIINGDLNKSLNSAISTLVSAGTLALGVILISTITKLLLHHKRKKEMKKFGQL